MASELSPLLLRPAEYTEDDGHAVCGRVVIHRKFEFQQQQQYAAGKGKSAKNGKNASVMTMKCELHILGGNDIRNVAYVEAWGEAAQQLASLAPLGTVISIRKAKMIKKSQPYSTSTLAWFLRVNGPIGINTIIRRLDDEPWDMPEHHPFCNLDAVQRINGTRQLCVVAVVSQQTPCVTRDTVRGACKVCNTTVKHEGTEIRCSFWREKADLAQFPEGTVLCFMQVVVHNKGARGWELGATEATQVYEAPEELRDEILTASQVTTTISLTQSQYVNYETCAAIPTTLSALAFIIVQGTTRDLRGVYEAHNISIVNVAGVGNASNDDDQWHMLSCDQCKKKVQGNRCVDHADATVSARWMIQLELADSNGSTSTILYHEIAEKLSCFEGIKPNELTLPLKKKAAQMLRSLPWSVKLIFKIDEYRKENILDMKALSPTFTEEGVVTSWPEAPLPTYLQQSGCPFARCEDVTYDKDLGVHIVKDIQAKAVRLLVQTMITDDSFEVAAPDAHHAGLRVTQPVECLLRDSASVTTFYIETAGVSSAVQWLLRGDAGKVFFITACLREKENTFGVQAYYEVPSALLTKFKEYVALWLSRQDGIRLPETEASTPCKRQRIVQQATPPAADASDFSIRRQLDF